jgi:hypothetical protein
MTMTWSSSYLELYPTMTPLCAATGVGGVQAIMVITLVVLIMRGRCERALGPALGLGRLPRLSQVFFLSCRDRIPHEEPI